MFIVNEEGNKCVELKTVNIYKRMTDSVLEHIDKIENDTMKNAYNYGSTDKAKKVAKERIDECLESEGDDAFIWVIAINEKVFGKFVTEDGAKLAFNKILDGIKLDRKFFDMRV